MTPDPSPIDLTLDGIGKVYPGVVALREVSLAIGGGEILGIIGENGAGKSTLMKILGGTIRPDAGRILIDGMPVAALTPALASAAGIAFVHQELNTLSNLDVAGNVLLGRESVKGPFRVIDHPAMARRVQPVLDLLGARFGPADPVADLSVADRQLVEIARALSMQARLVILDEPTSSLTTSETARLLDVMRGLRAKGVAVVFISHRLREVEEVCDRVVVLRDGQVVGELTGEGIGRDRMVSLMIGRDLKRMHAQAGRAAGKPALELRGVRTTTYPQAAVDLTVAEGEILGLAGLVGAGRSELARAVFGVDRAHGGEVIVGGAPMEPGSVAAALGAGLCLVPEDRKQQGLFLDFSVSDNLVLPSLGRLTPGFLIDRRALDGLAAGLRDRLAIKVAAVGRAAAELSGGNQQKVVLAKWLAMDPRVIILDEPTRGIDIGAKAEVYALMRGLADAGVGILMISSDMEEVVGVSDRVAVMANGTITGILAGEEIAEEAILRLAVH
jgi:ribose transport system ATP-binding protein